MSPVPLHRRFARYTLAHVAGYPLALIWAVASIPLTIRLFDDELTSFDDHPDAVGRAVVRRLALPAALAFAAPHVVAWPWAFGRDPSRWARRTWIAIGAVALTGIAFGASSWAWLFLR